MAIDVKTVAVLDGSTALFSDRVILGMKYRVANLVGTAGNPVATAVTFAESLPASYMVLVSPNQNVVSWVTAKTAAGFTVNMIAPLAAGNVAAGTFDFIVLA